MPATEFGGQPNDRLFSFTVAALDLGNHLAEAAVDSVVNVPSGVVLRPTDKIVAIPPAALSAALSVQSARYTSASTLTLRTVNHSAGAVDPAAADWEFLVVGK